MGDGGEEDVQVAILVEVTAVDAEAVAADVLAGLAAGLGLLTVVQVGAPGIAAGLAGHTPRHPFLCEARGAVV